MTYRIGVDVGGTFTDVVCVAADGTSCTSVPTLLYSWGHSQVSCTIGVSADVTTYIG